MGDPAIPGMVLSGPAGVGKTSLARQVTQDADAAQYVTRWVAATPATACLPFGALSSLLPAVLPHAASRTNLLRQVADLLVAPVGQRRLILAVDDAHLLDDTSAALLHQLVQARDAFVFVTLRSGEPAPEPIISLWREQLVPRLDLRPLHRREVEYILVGVLGGPIDGMTARRLWVSTRSNMLLLREIVNAGLEAGALTQTAGVWRWDGPFIIASRLVELIGNRIGRLVPEEQHLLEIVAHGEPLEADLIAQIVSPDVLLAVEGKGLVVVAEDRHRVHVSLPHPIYGEVLRSRCPPLRTRRWRQQLADAVEKAGMRRKDDSLRIAVWHLDSHDPVRLDTLLAAARRAWALLDLPLTEKLAIAALNAGGGVAAGKMLWRVLLAAERSADAEKLLCDLRESAQTEQERAELAIGRAWNLFWGLDAVEKATAVLADVFATVTDPIWRAEIMVLRAVFAAYQNRWAEAVDIAADLLADGPASPRARAQAHVVQGMSLTHLGRPSEAITALDRASQPIAEWTGRLPYVAETANVVRCHAYLFSGMFAEAEQVAAAAYDSAVFRGWDWAVVFACLARAQASRFRGRARDASRWLREALSIYRRQPSGNFMPGVCLFGELAHAEALTGDGGSARQAMAEADARRRQSQRTFELWADLARPWVAAASGDTTKAVDMALALSLRTRECGARSIEALALHDLVRLGRPGRAVGRLGELAADTPSRLTILFARHAEAAASRDGPSLDAVASSFRVIDATLLAAETFAQASLAHKRAGRSASMRRSRAEAAVLAGHCQGATTPALRQFMVPVLTERERDVARLAVAGLSNMDIARRLVISKRTVDNHLHKIYAKLGINSRWALKPFL